MAQKRSYPFIDRWFSIFTEHFKVIVIVFIVVLLSIILFLGWLSAKKVREVVVEDFNKQQLVLAQYVASMIEVNLNHIKREMTLLSLSPSVQYADSHFLFTRLKIAHLSIKDIGCVDIQFLSAINQKTYVVNVKESKINPLNKNDIDLLKSAERGTKKGAIYIGPAKHLQLENNKRLIMNIAMPVWQTASDDLHPSATEKFSGLIVMNIDVQSLIESTTRDIRPIKEGYVWVINELGTFLYHPEPDFVGKNAFSARSEKMPQISYVKINEIQKEKMLKGETGTSWYISGWHKDITGEVKKLIAYAPVFPDENNKNSIWSVAVVAPINAIEDNIDDIQLRQFILEGFIIMIVLSCGAFLMALMLRWSQSLKEEVDRKTKELKNSELRYKSLIENANDIIFTVDNDGKILTINKAGAVFFMRDNKHILGSNIAELCFNEDSGYLQIKTIEDVIRTGQSKKITYSVNITDNEYWLNTSFTPLEYTDDKPTVILGISRDITAEKKKDKQEQMYHAEKLASMGTLAAGVAHEINNPLAVILGFVDLLLEKYPPDSQEYDILKTIEKQATNAKRVVENLLSFSRYTEYHEELVDINEAIESVLKIIINTMKIKNIEHILLLAEDLPRVKADAGELQQVFLNIINNAIHAMAEGGTLTIITKNLISDPKIKQVEIRFSDTGHGIKKEHRSKIFDPLFTTKKVGEGTGLGLSVSYGIITKYGGSITFETATKEESEKPGTTFIITLPAASVT